MARASAPLKTRHIESVMREEQSQSVAFRNAELGSERLRIFGVVGLFAIFMLITVVRVVCHPHSIRYRSVVMDPDPRRRCNRLRAVDVE